MQDRIKPSTESATNRKFDEGRRKSSRTSLPYGMAKEGVRYADKRVRIVHRADRRYTILSTLKCVALQVLYGFPNPARTGRVFVCL